jgi:hypothetical protein
MWCIPNVNERFIERMEDVLELYTRPYDEDEPVICFDEKSKQLLKDTRNQLPMRPGKTRRRDYEYKRNGTQNIFVAVEPKAGYRRVTVTDRRTKSDFAKEIKKLIELSRYKQIKTIHIVLDNLNTHFPTSFYETFTQPVADRLLERIMFHYTPTHASWLNMAEIELSILSRQALNQRIATKEQLIETARTYQKRRNKQWATISWKFTKKDARKVFKYDRKN